MDLELIINKLEDKVNDFNIKDEELEKLEVIKDRLEATYRCQLRKELLRSSLNNTKISISSDIARVDWESTSDNAKLAQLRLNKDLAEMRYYSMKSSIENIKFEIEVLRSVLTWLSVELECLKVKVKRYPCLN